jgi:hypothetical protein
VGQHIFPTGQQGVERRRVITGQASFGLDQQLLRFFQLGFVGRVGIVTQVNERGGKRFPHVIEHGHSTIVRRARVWLKHRGPTGGGLHDISETLIRPVLVRSRVSQIVTGNKSSQAGND